MKHKHYTLKLTEIVLSEFTFSIINRNDNSISFYDSKEQPTKILEIIYSPYTSKISRYNRVEVLHFGKVLRKIIYFADHDSVNSCEAYIDGRLEGELLNYDYDVIDYELRTKSKVISILKNLGIDTVYKSTSKAKVIHNQFSNKLRNHR